VPTCTHLPPSACLSNFHFGFDLNSDFLPKMPSQVSSVLADPSSKPRQVSVNVDAVPLTATHYWLATVLATVVGGKTGSPRVVPRPVPQTAAQPRRSQLSGCGAVPGRTTRPSASPTAPAVGHRARLGHLRRVWCRARRGAIPHDVSRAAAVTRRTFGS
jgi:hypothetical protein